MQRSNEYRKQLEAGHGDIERYLQLLVELQPRLSPYPFNLEYHFRTSINFMERYIAEIKKELEKMNDG